MDDEQHAQQHLEGLSGHHAITHVILSLGNIEKSLASMNDRLSKLEGKMNSALMHDSHRRSTRLSSAGASFRSHASSSHHQRGSFRHTGSIARKDNSLLSPESEHEDSAVMIHLDEEVQSPRYPFNVDGRGPQRRDSDAKSSSPASSTEFASPKFRSEESIAAVSAPLTDENPHHSHSKTIQSFQELVTVTKIKRKLKAKSRPVMPALHEHSTLDDRSIAPTYATSLDEYGDNNNDLEKNSISTFSAPISPQVLSPRTQSFPHDTKEPPNDVRQSLATKSANWLRLNLTQLSSRSQPQLSQHNEMPSEVSLPRPNKDVRLLSIMFNHQIKRTATG